MKFRRTNLTIVFSILLVVAMWFIISAEEIKFLSNFVFTGNKDIQDIVCYSSLGAAMFFAMSTVRGAQPGVPTTTCWTDVSAFYMTDSMWQAFPVIF
ncbi:hypothetical protein BC938DRAFT_479907 [Jimgerdemannia flammicorona]|uniref:Uncharacterized protein n=1 Tax=Jimgerdemannia flammicorona TaxID=994334 RepID=A0A433QJT7_9FUNG|nr:hypothetical protein BC938DRAFT_479907 [Jimgerdemannia flammicorona]